VLCRPATAFGLLTQIGVSLATGNAARIYAPSTLQSFLAKLPPTLRTRLLLVTDASAEGCGAVLFEGDGDALRDVAREVAALEGPIVPVLGATPDGLAAGSEDYALDLLVAERSISTNTAAAGGNASLMTLE
jgi:RHH-type proline utilization regulon transcriptional repressor/proline dehydrogenase/delta 1-pyrroline-5-carboxylate dehydrogenase